MEGLSKEGEGIVEGTDEGTATRDVGIILASQKVEHYEIATYGGLTQLAKTLGFDDVAEILAETLSEENRRMRYSRKSPKMMSIIRLHRKLDHFPLNNSIMATKKDCPKPRGNKKTIKPTASPLTQPMLHRSS